MKKFLMWPTVVTLFLFVVVWIGMQYSDEISWNLMDFVMAALLIFGSFVSYALLANRIPKHKNIIAFGILVIFVYIWAELAVGIFTNLGS
jgi:hypothetical protein